jgi:hypothetical protein
LYLQVQRGCRNRLWRKQNKSEKRSGLYGVAESVSCGRDEVSSNHLQKFLHFGAKTLFFSEFVL